VPDSALPLCASGSCASSRRVRDRDKPDEVNWGAGRDSEDRTRQICNGWRADNVVAAQVLSEQTGRLTAQLARYHGSACSRTTPLEAAGRRRSASTRDGSYATTWCRPR